MFYIQIGLTQTKINKSQKTKDGKFTMNEKTSKLKFEKFNLKMEKFYKVKGRKSVSKKQPCYNYQKKKLG